jgi:hypothetical protein
MWNEAKVMVRALCLPAVLAILLAQLCNAFEWQIEMVDDTGAGQYSSLKIDTDGNAHVAYVVESTHGLKYGFWDHKLKRWFTMPVAGGASFCSLTLDSKQRPHLSYADFGTGKGAMLRYVYWDGASWKGQGIPIKTADVIAYYTSIALDRNDRPTISFYNYEGSGGGFVLTMRTASWNGSYWESRTVDGTYGSGKFNYIASDTAGRPHLVYANVGAMNASLRYARWDGDRWRAEILEGADHAYYVESVAIAIDSRDTPHITYTDVVNQVVKYATRQGGKWSFQRVDTLLRRRYPDRNGIALDVEGNPFISYFDAATGLLKVASKSNDKWLTEVVDQSFSGYTSSLQIARGVLWVTYCDDSGGLKCARRNVSDSKRTDGKPGDLPFKDMR